MILIFKENATTDQINEMKQIFVDRGFVTHLSKGTERTLMGLIGDTSSLDLDSIQAMEPIESVKRITEPYKAVNRKMHPQDTILPINGFHIGEGYFHVMAGPCSVESEEQISAIAESVKKSGASFLRGGAFKPRTSPYAFQGLKADGIRLLLEAKKITGMPIITEIMDLSSLDLFQDVDIIQVGARNMQNFTLLKELGHCRKPILLKRGLANTIEELLMSTEYVISGGNSNVILCERGIRTFENSTRNTLDISAIPMLKKQSHLPVIVDPSHASGLNWMVAPLSKAAIACGADGLMIEVHNNPAKALCDGPQSQNPLQFEQLMQDIQRRVHFEGKKMNE